ncbi:MAG TPA: TonB-dependent receptor, partial [Flavobacterium sp.]|nr:TonB-dependent receptor [Flavobacterium sp.]
FDIADTNIRANFIADYVGGTFLRNYLGTTPASYGYANFGVHPSFTIVKNDWSIDLGVAAFYSMDVENSDGDVYVYPQVKASLNVVGDLMIFYAGAEGTLEQNSYKDFVDENPFVSPYLSISPTDRQYDVFAGLKGKLANSVSYNLRGSYMNEQNRAMFINNPFPTTTNAIYAGYEYGNSFGVVYDQVTTLSFFGELKADFSKTVAFGINGTFATYDTDLQAEAWNLPELKVSSSLDVNITKKWYAGATVFFIGERKDYFDLSRIAGNSRIVTLDPYFDANMHVGYQHNERLSGFLKFNNIANQAYEKWINYPVQQFQVMLGANYKFDF